MNNEQLLRRIEILEMELKKLRAEATIPLDIDRAFRARFGLESLGGSIKTSTKGVDTEDVTVVNSVNFGGSSVTTTTVMDDPTGFFTLTTSTGQTGDVPYF